MRSGNWYGNFLSMFERAINHNILDFLCYNLYKMLVFVIVLVLEKTYTKTRATSSELSIKKQGGNFKKTCFFI